MEVAVINTDNIRIIECLSQIGRIDDVVQLVTACIEHDSERLLLESQVLPDSFFDLRTLFAGEFIQKIQNYNIRTAAVISSHIEYSQRFQEFVFEAKRGRTFRISTSRAEALNWLVQE